MEERTFSASQLMMEKMEVEKQVEQLLNTFIRKFSVREIDVHVGTWEIENHVPILRVSITFRF